MSKIVTKRFILGFAVSLISDLAVAQAPIQAPSSGFPTEGVSLRQSRASSQSQPAVISSPQSVVNSRRNQFASTAIFIENQGQFDSRVRYQVKIGAQTAWLTDVGVVYDATRPIASEPATTTRTALADRSRLLSPSAALDRSKPQPRSLERLVFTEDFVHSDCCSKIEGQKPLPGLYNYFQSRDSSDWRTNVHSYSEVVYRGVWPGIDLRIYGNGADLEQEFIIQPGGDLSQVQISYRGIDGLNVAKDGSLEVATAFGKLRETKPRLYQEMENKKVIVDGRYRLTGARSYTFDGEAHNPLYALVVDPTLLYSTFLGGSAGTLFRNIQEEANGIAVDTSGNAYVAGITASTDFPTTPGAFQVGPPSGSFITKLNATGSALVYSTYLGSGATITSIAVDAAGRAYVTGVAGAVPTTPNAYWPTDTLHSCASDFYVTELSSVGDSLVYSSCFNISSDAVYRAEYGYYPRAIAVDGSGRIYIGGGAVDGVPTTANAYQVSAPGGPSAYVAVFDTTGSGASSLVYASYLGPTSNQVSALAFGVAVDSFGKVYLAGGADAGFPITPGAFQTTYPGTPSAFVAKIDPSSSGQSSLIYSTYLGGSPGCGSGCAGSSATAIAVDGSGEAFVAGSASAGSFPVTSGAFETIPPGGFSTQFVAKLNAGGSNLLYSTFLYSVTISGLTIDASGNAYVVGAASTNLAVTPNAYQSTFTESQDAFLTVMNSTGSGLVYSSYLGGLGGSPSGQTFANGVAVDQTGDVYVAGWTSAFDFPSTPFAFQPALNPNPISCNGAGDGCFGTDAFVTKFPLGTGQALSITSLTPTSGGNAGTVSPQIFGTGLHDGATAKLNCSGASIGGANLIVGPGGRFLNTTFDLTTASPGVCNVLVSNPDGTSVTLSRAFTVQQGGAPNIQIDLTGVEERKVPGEVALGPADAVVLATVSNTGNVDAAGGFVYLPLNSGFTLTSTSPDVSSASASALVATSLSSSTGLLTIPSSGISYLRNLPSHQSQVVTSTATNPLSSAVCSALWGPVCFTQNMVAAVDCIVAEDSSAGLKCATAAVACGAAAACLLAGGAVCSGLIQTCISQSLAPASTGGSGCLTNPVVQACIVKNSSSCTSSFLPCVVPADPNNLVGSLGVGGQRWIPGGQALSYIISFGNEPSAAVPAQRVVVTQPLGSNVNLSTLTLPAITIPNSGTAVLVPIPPGGFNPAANVTEFMTDVDLRPSQSLLVNVDVKLNPATQTLTWTFTSIDPTTGMPPLNPLIGFLPPGAGANVSFSVTSTLGLATGSQVAEQATIIFQGASPMSTPTWTNTIDNTPPVSHVSALTATSTCPAFRVSWSGSDVGSGLEGFTIYVSDAGGRYTAWLSNTTAASADYIGVIGHSYSFYSIATDLTGNKEGSKTSAEASTSVTATGPCGPPSMAAQVSNVAQSGTTVTATLTLTNTGFTAATAININQVAVRTLSGSGTVTLASPALPAAEGPLATGASTTVTLTLNVPTTVKRFSLTETGNVKDSAGNTYNYSMAQTVIP